MSSSTPQRIIKLWQRIYGARGGEGPRATPDIVTVIIADDHSKGGWTAGAPWITYGDTPALAANFATGAVLNNDPLGRKSLVVVDRVRVWVGVATRLLISLQWDPVRYAGIGAPSQLADFSEPALTPQNQILQAVFGVSSNVSPAIGGVPFDVPAGATEIGGAWSFGPGVALVVGQSNANNALACYFSGRYYSEP